MGVGGVVDDGVKTVRDVEDDGVGSSVLPSAADSVVGVGSSAVHVVGDAHQAEDVHGFGGAGLSDGVPSGGAGDDVEGEGSRGGFSDAEDVSEDTLLSADGELDGVGLEGVFNLSCLMTKIILFVLIKFDIS